MAGGKNKKFPKAHQLHFHLRYSMLISLENYEIRPMEAVNYLSVWNKTPIPTRKHKCDSRNSPHSPH